jgi:anaerobic ribonucleoside-triphosphate reductase
MRQIRKRNGSVVDFNAEKITNAMKKAFLALNVAVEEDKLHGMTHFVVTEVEKAFSETLPTVEDVQDKVEQVLMREGFHTVAKSYIVYRYEHAKIRVK